MTGQTLAHDVRFEPHESPPHVLAAGLGAQMVVLIVTGIMVTPLVVARAAELPPATASWLVFTALIASGIATWLQIGRIGRIGGGYVLFVGSNVAFVSVSVSAIQQGGVPLLATLVCVASLATFLFTARMGALRRVLTPAVGGTVLMLMALSVAPVAWGMLKKVPPEFAGTGVPPVLLLSTLVPIVAISLFAGPRLQLWAPLIGVSNGTTSGGLTAMILMALLSLRARSRDKLSAPLAIGVLGELKALVTGFCKRLGWDTPAENRLMLAAEESLLFLLDNQARAAGEGTPTQLHVRLRQVGNEAELEHISGPTTVNVESLVATLSAASEPSPEEELSLRLLRGMTKELRHLQYHGTDYLLMRVDSSA